MAAERKKAERGDFQVTTCYRFLPLAPAQIEELRSGIETCAAELGVFGLILLGGEGINLTAAGSRDSIGQFKRMLGERLGCALEFKDSYSPFQPFRRLKVDIREEIVTMLRTDIVPDGPNNHLSPAEWERVLTSEEDFVLLDTRNVYETAIGKFAGALDPEIDNFSEFPEWVRECGIPKEKKILMYCTGGIRCEKASLAMQSQGYSNVFQLGGGILKYLQEFPDRSFEGECFVFDHRVALDQRLEPSCQYKLCPHCGNPAREIISCNLCGEHCIVCAGCLADEKLRTCSKNCAHHFSKKLPRTM